MRWLYVTLGHLCVVVGVIGIFLPLLPTTPFLLLAAFCYSKGSERLHAWLLSHPRLGGPVTRWQEHGVITTRAKVISVVLIVASMSYPLLFRELPAWARIAASATAIGVIAFLVTRPSTPEESRRRRSSRATGPTPGER